MPGRLLDDVGLSEVWKKIIGRSIPVKGLTQAQYNTLIAAEKRKDILYVVTTGDTGLRLYYKQHLLISTSENNVYVSAEEPDDMKPGDIWFNEVE